MKKITIPKKNGTERLIYACSKKETAKFRSILQNINQNDLKYAYGFIKGRNIVSAAKQHIDRDVTISMDLKDFFDTVKLSQVEGKIEQYQITTNKDGYRSKTDIFDECFPDGAPRQGLATSPAIANIAGKAIDDSIVRALKKLGIRCAYTRYADDICVSINGTGKDIIDKVMTKMRNCIIRCGFKVNEKKTRIQYAKYGRRQILGIMVDNDNVYISRKTRRKARSAVFKCFQNPTSKHFFDKAQGLVEFCQLKEPRTFGEKMINKSEYKKRKDIDDFNNVAETTNKFKHWRLCSNPEKSIKDTDLGKNCFISTDPLYFAGMSYFTTGWTSCMNILESGTSFSSGIKQWIQLEGCSIAFSLDKTGKTKVLAGTERVVMRERTLVFQLIDGRKCFGRIYSGEGGFYYEENENRAFFGETKDSTLIAQLINNGFVPASVVFNQKSWKTGEVIGTVPYCDRMPYTDQGGFQKKIIDSEILKKHPGWMDLEYCSKYYI
jgi:hypothetical protein